jgi:hypothetical protein
VSFIFTSYILSFISFSLFLPISHYDFLILFFLSFSFSSLSLLYLHFSYFCNFSLLMSMNLAVCNRGHLTLFSSG